MANSEWAYATSEEPDFWPIAGSRDDAISEAREAAGDNGTPWIHEAKKVENSVFYMPDFDQLCDDMNQSAVDNGCPDEIDEAFDFHDGAEEAWAKMIAEWAAKYVTPKWYEMLGKPIKVAPQEVP